MHPYRGVGFWRWLWHSVRHADHYTYLWEAMDMYVCDTCKIACSND